MYELLKGIRIVDLTTTYLGPYATQFLGDMGAEMIKVESLQGDVGRSPRPAARPIWGLGSSTPTATNAPSPSTYARPRAAMWF